MAITKAVESLSDWTAVAQNTIDSSGSVDCSGHYGTELHIQAGLDNSTAHTGTEFIVQVSSNTSGGEDWHNLTNFVGLIGTANPEGLSASLEAGTQAASVASTTGYTTLGIWIFLEDQVALADSELCFLTAVDASASISLLDGVTGSHATSASFFNIALSKPVSLPTGTNRARVVVDNSYDADGATLNYRVRSTQVTAV